MRNQIFRPIVAKLIVFSGHIIICDETGFAKGVVIDLSWFCSDCASGVVVIEWRVRRLEGLPSGEWQRAVVGECPAAVSRRPMRSEVNVIVGETKERTNICQWVSAEVHYLSCSVSYSSIPSMLCIGRRADSWVSTGQT